MTTDYAQYVDPTVDSDEDDGTMPANIAEFADHIIGRRIVKVEPKVTEMTRPYRAWPDMTQMATFARLTLDNGKTVQLSDGGDCCAYTDLEEVIQHLPSLDHVITSVTTTDGYTRWHILADMGEVLEFKVDWSCGNPFYYTYGFEIAVTDGGDEA